MAMLQKNCGSCGFQICSQGELAAGRCWAQKRLPISLALLKKLWSLLEEELHTHNIGVIALVYDLDKISKSEL